MGDVGIERRHVAPTLEEVASAAGVSRSTVSRVINSSPNVSPEVIASVSAAVDQLGYVPNRAARSLANRRTMAIALVIPEDATRFFGDPYLASIVSGISRELEYSDYVLNLQLSSPSSPSDKTVKYLLGGNVDGALVVSHHSGDHFLASLGATLPVVFGGRPLDPDEYHSYFVDVDNRGAAAGATRHLIERGHRRIATITGPPDMPASMDRINGWRDAMEGAGLRPDLLADGDFTVQGGARAMRELLARADDIEAVFAASDLMALGALNVLRDRGIEVPRQLAVMGFDDSPAAAISEIPLTTVRQPSTEAGARMARMLLQLLRGEPTERASILPTELVVRQSA